MILLNHQKDIKKFFREREIKNMMNLIIDENKIELIKNNDSISSFYIDYYNDKIEEFKKDLEIEIFRNI